MQRIAFPVFFSQENLYETEEAKMSLEKKHNLTGWAFLIPAALLIFIFCFYPMIQAIILSFSKKGSGFVGLANYRRILKDKTFQQCLFNTVFYFIIQVPVMLILALGLAQLLNSPKIKGKSIFRTLIFLPCATSLVSYSMIFKSLFAQDGLVNPYHHGIGICQGRLVSECMGSPFCYHCCIDLEMDRI